MKKIVNSLFVFLLLFSSLSFADVYCEKIVYDYIYEFKYGIARVEKDGKYGCMNLSGDIVVDIIYDYLEDFNTDGYAYAYEGENRKVIDMKGNSYSNQVMTSHEVKTQKEWEEITQFTYDTKKIHNGFGKQYLHNELNRVKTGEYDYVGDSMNLKGELFFFGFRDGHYDVYNKDLTKINTSDVKYLSVIDRNGYFYYCDDSNIFLSDSYGNIISSRVYDKEKDFYIWSKSERSDEYFLSRSDGRELSKEIYSALGDRMVFITEDFGCQMDGVVIGKVKNKDEMDFIDLSTGKIKKYEGEIYDHTVRFGDGYVRFLENDKGEELYKVLNNQGVLIGAYSRTYGLEKYNDISPFSSQGEILSYNNKIDLDRNEVSDNLEKINQYLSSRSFKKFFRLSFLGDAIAYKMDMGESDYRFLIRLDSMKNPTFSFRDVEKYLYGNDNSSYYKEMDLIMSLFKEYSDDGDKIFDYVYNNCFSGNIVYDKVLTIGNSSILITDPISIQGDDYGLNDFEVHILNNGVDTAKLDYEVVSLNSIIKLENIHQMDGRLMWKGNSTLKEDIEYFNKTLGNFPYKFDPEGRLGIVTADGVLFDSNLSLGVAIRRNDNDMPQIRISSWSDIGIIDESISYDKKKAYYDMESANMCLIKDLLKFYFTSDHDVDLFMNWMNDTINNRRNIDMSKTYEYGITRLKFTETEYNNFGVYINIVE